MKPTKEDKSCCCLSYERGVTPCQCGCHNKTNQQAIAEERERIIKWAEKYMDKTIKYYGTDKHGIALDDLIQELTK